MRKVARICKWLGWVICYHPAHLKAWTTRGGPGAWIPSFSSRFCFGLSSSALTGFSSFRCSILDGDLSFLFFDAPIDLPMVYQARNNNPLQPSECWNVLDWMCKMGAPEFMTFFESCRTYPISIRIIVSHFLCWPRVFICMNRGRNVTRFRASFSRSAQQTWTKLLVESRNIRCRTLISG